MCTICEHYGIEKEATESEILFHENKQIKIALCRKHSIELFKKGQKKFLIKHHKILFNIIDSNHPKFIDLLQETYKNNLNLIY